MNEFIYSFILSEGLTKLILNTGTRLTLVTECYYTFNYKDHWMPDCLHATHYFIISSDGVVYSEIQIFFWEKGNFSARTENEAS